MVGFASSSFTLLNALSCSGPNNHADILLRSCRKGWVRSARFWENLPSWFTIPMKYRISVILVGGSMSVMADVFFGSARTPSRSTRWPRNFSCVFPKSHLLGFRESLQLLGFSAGLLSGACCVLLCLCRRLAHHPPDIVHCRDLRGLVTFGFENAPGHSISRMAFCVSNILRRN